MPSPGSVWDAGKSGSSSSKPAALPPPPPDDPEDTNDDFCFQCGGGGDLLLCDKCDRCAHFLALPSRAPPSPPLLALRSRRARALRRCSSYHMYCVDPPLDEAPEGEWACPAHRPGQRGRKKEAELLALDQRSGTDRGMRHKPPRLDTKYQILPDVMIPASEQAAERAAGKGDKAGRRAWVVAEDADGDGRLSQLLAFTHALVNGDFGSEVRFNEHTMSHLHLWGYQLPKAQAHLLRVSKAVKAMPRDAAERLGALGYAHGEVLMALLGRAHDDAAGDARGGLGALMRSYAPGIDAVLDATGAFDVAALALLADEGDASASAALATHEAELSKAQAPAVAKWEAELSSRLARGDMSLESLKELVASGAAAFLVNVKYLSNGGRTARLAELRASLEQATAWHDRCVDLLAKPTNPDSLATLLSDGESGSIQLREMGDVRVRLERMRSWAVGAAKVMGQPCELKELLELQRESEAIRIRTIESEALSSRAAAAKKWTTRVHNELLRRKSSRKAEGVKLSCADVETLLSEAVSLQLEAPEIEQATEKLADARAWAVEASSVLDPPVAVTQEVLASLCELAARAENLNMLLENHEALDARVATVRGWLSRAKAAMADLSSTWQVLTGLVKEARAAKIDLPEVPLLAEQQAEQAWVGQAELALSGSAQLEDLEQLDADAHRLAESARAADMAKKIKVKLAAAKRWEARLAEEVTPTSRPGLKEASVLLSEADADKVLMPAIDELRACVGKAKGWLESVRRTQSRSTRGVATRATLPELRELFAVGQALPLSLPEVGTLALQVCVSLALSTCLHFLAPAFLSSPDPRSCPSVFSCPRSGPLRPDPPCSALLRPSPYPPLIPPPRPSSARPLRPPLPALARPPPGRSTRPRNGNARPKTPSGVTPARARAPTRLAPRQWSTARVGSASASSSLSPRP